MASPFNGSHPTPTTHTQHIMTEVYIADCQDITRAGLQYVLERIDGVHSTCAADTEQLLRLLPLNTHCVVVVDYTLFDFNDVTEMLIVSQRVPKVHWVIFSEDLSIDFAKQLVMSSTAFSIVMKESPLNEIREALQYALRGQRFICQHMAEMLLAPSAPSDEQVNLTKTEIEILKCIAIGMTTKDIAEKRFSSFHTINTHRKNIFRKLGVNNVHEATKYALRAGLVDSAEYYI